MKYKLVAFFLLVMSLQAHSASFDCAKAKTIHEKFICGNPNLDALDKQLVESY